VDRFREAGKNALAIVHRFSDLARRDDLRAGRE
jgi:hypothetical protein